MKFIVLIILCLFLLVFTSCSKNELKGTVSDSNTKKSIQGVTVTIEGTTYITLTDSMGMYHLSEFPDGNYSVKFSKEEYLPYLLTINSKDGNELLYNIELTLDQPSDAQIQEFLKNKFKSESKMGTFAMYTKKYSNVKLLNQWKDENYKGIYYVKVSFDFEDNWFKSSCVHIWRFSKQGNHWQVGDYPIDKDCIDQGGKGLFQR